MIEDRGISLVGMSGSGKSHWSKELQKTGFKIRCCDDLIEDRLGDELKGLGYSGIQDVAKWMGQPYDPQYERTSRRYLELEEEVTSEVLAAVERSSSRGNIVIDTTGSVIYLSSKILSKLSAITRVVYLETPDIVRDKMFQLYIADPKPVIWGGSFNKKEGESNLAALSRCYLLLLEYRASKYANLAQVTLDYHTLRHPEFNVEDFIAAIAT